MKIQIEESALDSMEAMVKQLQTERDMLLEAIADLNEEFKRMRSQIVSAHLPTNYAQVEAMQFANTAIAACTESTKVMQ